METVLNKGLKFSILPLKLDITRVLTDFRGFERTMIGREFWYGKDSAEFKERKQIYYQEKEKQLSQKLQNTTRLTELPGGS